MDGAPEPALALRAGVIWKRARSDARLEREARSHTIAATVISRAVEERLGAE